MQFSLTPDAISKLDGINPGLFGLALDATKRMQQGDEFTLQKAIDDNTFEQQKQPLELARLGLQNETTAAQLPGLRADSGMRERKNSMEELFHPEAIESLRGKYSTEQHTRAVADMTNTGSAMLAASAMIQKAPLGGIAMAREALSKVGAWRPEWDNANPMQLQQFFANTGRELTTAGSKAQQVLQAQEMKALAAQQLESQRAANAMARQQAALAARQELAVKLAEMKANKETPVKSYEQLAAATAAQIARLEADTEVNHSKEIAQLQALKREADVKALNLKTQPGVAPTVGSDGQVKIEPKRAPVPGAIPSDVKVKW